MKLSLKFLSLVFILVLTMIPVKSYSQQANLTESVDYNEVYKELAVVLNTLEEKYYSAKTEEPEIFGKIDSIFEEYKTKAGNVTKSFIAESGLDPSDFKNPNSPKMRQVFENAIKKSMADPDIANLRNMMLEKILEAREQGFEYQPKMLRDPIGFGSELAAQNPAAIDGIAKYMAKNKDVIIEKIKQGVAEAKKRNLSAPSAATPQSRGNSFSRP